MNIKKSRLHKIAAAATALCVAFTQVAIAAPAFSVPTHEVSLPDTLLLDQAMQISVPSAVATIDKLIPGNGKTIFHIQTAHGQYQAEKQIEALLTHLEKSYGVETLLMEGASQPLDPEIINFFPEDRKSTLEAVDAFVRHSVVSGPEVFLLNSGKARGLGIEDEAAYEQNLQDFAAVISARDSSSQFLSDLEQGIERLAALYLSSDARSFLKQVERKETGDVPFDIYLQQLKLAAEKHAGINLTDASWQLLWPMLTRVFTIEKLEKKIDAAAFKKQKEDFLKAVKPALPREIYSEVEKLLNLKDLSAKLPDPATSALFESLVRSLPDDFNYGRFSSVTAFCGLLMLKSQLNVETLSDEIGRLEDKIADKLAETKNAKDLVSVLKDYRLLKKLFALELLPTDFDKLSSASIQPSQIIEKLKSVNGNARAKEITFTNSNELNALYDKAVRFYEGARNRDTQMLRRIEERLSDTGADKVAVVTGGFHSGPFAKYFEERGYSYALMTPKLTTIDAQGRQNYLDVMQMWAAMPKVSDTKVSDDYVAVDASTITQPLLTAMGNRARQFFLRVGPQFSPKNLWERLVQSWQLKYAAVGMTAIGFPGTAFSQAPAAPSTPAPIVAPSKIPVAAIPADQQDVAKSIVNNLNIRTPDFVAESDKLTLLQRREIERRNTIITTKLEDLKTTDDANWGARLFMSVLDIAFRDSEDIKVRKKALEVLTGFYRKHSLPDRGVTDQIAPKATAELKFRYPDNTGALNEPRIALISEIVQSTQDNSTRQRGQKILAQDAEGKRLEALEKIKADEAILDNAIDELIVGNAVVASLAIVKAKLLDPETPQFMRDKTLRLFESFRQGVPQGYPLGSSILLTIPLLMQDYVRFEKDKQNLLKVKQAYDDYVKNGYSKSPYRAVQGQRGEDIIKNTGVLIDAAIKSRSEARAAMEALFENMPSWDQSPWDNLSRSLNTDRKGVGQEGGFAYMYFYPKDIGLPIVLNVGANTGENELEVSFKSVGVTWEKGNFEDFKRVILERFEEYEVSGVALSKDLFMANSIRKVLALPADKQEAAFSKLLNQANAEAGDGAKFLAAEEPKPAVIPYVASEEDRIAYLKSVAAGEVGFVDFAAGAATRLKVGAEFDPIGLVGLSKSILEKFPRTDDDKPAAKDFQNLIERAAAGKVEAEADLTFLQLQMLSLSGQFARLVEETPDAGVSLWDVLGGVRFISVANDDNDDAFRAQMGSIQGAGFGGVYQITQFKAGVEKILPDGTTEYTDELKVPEGHLVPLLDLAKREGGSYKLEAGSFVPVTTTLKEELKKQGVRRLVFAQGNDLFLLKDFAAVERVVTAQREMEKRGVKMMMEMVENGIKQKGGGTKVNPQTGFAWMRDTIGIGQGIVPASLSRMFYVIELDALDLVVEKEAEIPLYRNLKKLPSGGWALSKERLSGDASSVIPAWTMEKPGHPLITFKLRSRTDEALNFVDEAIGAVHFQATLKRFAPQIARSEARNVYQFPGDLEEVDFASLKATLLADHKIYALPLDEANRNRILNDLELLIPGKISGSWKSTAPVYVIAKPVNGALQIAALFQYTNAVVSPVVVFSPEEGLESQRLEKVFTAFPGTSTDVVVVRVNIPLEVAPNSFQLTIPRLPGAVGFKNVEEVFYVVGPDDDKQSTYSTTFVAAPGDENYQYLQQVLQQARDLAVQPEQIPELTADQPVFATVVSDEAGSILAILTGRAPKGVRAIEYNFAVLPQLNDNLIPVQASYIDLLRNPVDDRFPRLPNDVTSVRLAAPFNVVVTRDGQLRPSTLELRSVVTPAGIAQDRTLTSYWGRGYVISQPDSEVSIPAVQEPRDLLNVFSLSMVVPATATKPYVIDDADDKPLLWAQTPAGLFWQNLLGRVNPEQREALQARLTSVIQAQGLPLDFRAQDLFPVLQLVVTPENEAAGLIFRGVDGVLKPLATFSAESQGADLQLGVVDLRAEVAFTAVQTDGNLTIQPSQRSEARQYVVADFDGLDYGDQLVTFALPRFIDRVNASGFKQLIDADTTPLIVTVETGIGAKVQITVPNFADHFTSEGLVRAIWNASKTEANGIPVVDKPEDLAFGSWLKSLRVEIANVPSRSTVPVTPGTTSRSESRLTDEQIKVILEKFTSGILTLEQAALVLQTNDVEGDRIRQIVEGKMGGRLVAEQSESDASPLDQLLGLVDSAAPNLNAQAIQIESKQQGYASEKGIAIRVADEIRATIQSTPEALAQNLSQLGNGEYLDIVVEDGDQGAMLLEIRKALEGKGGIVSKDLREAILSPETGKVRIHERSKLANWVKGQAPNAAVALIMAGFNHELFDGLKDTDNVYRLKLADNGKPLNGKNLWAIPVVHVAASRVMANISGIPQAQAEAVLKSSFDQLGLKLTPNADGTYGFGAIATLLQAIVTAKYIEIMA